MNAHRIPRFSLWALARLAPESQREVLLGDLAEEYALRAAGHSSAAAAQWYRRQVRRSVLPLLWARLSGSWLSTIGIALLAYIAVGIVEFGVNSLLAAWAATHNPAYNPIGMALTFPAVVVLGYVATEIRRRADVALATMMLLSVAAMTIWGGESVPTWYRVAYFIVGPAATFIGSALRSLRVARL